MKTRERNVIDALTQLALKIKKEIDEGISRNILQPEEEVHFRWKVNEFEYTKGGVTKSSASGEYIIKKFWFKATIKVAEDIKKSNEYSSTLKLLSNIFGKERVSFALERFVQKLTSDFFTRQKLSEEDIDLFVTTFLKDLKEEPLKYGAKVELDGIVILPERIEFKIGDTIIILRQTKIEDLEKEFPVYGFPMEPYLKTPSAILNIEFLGRQANEIQLKVEQAIAILRLFKVGSVKYISYHMHSESITDVTASGTLTAREAVSALEKSQITEEDVQKLKKFWQVMIKALPLGFYELGEARLDHITIAYKRYCDALLQNGVLERRIANAVMGLESLFLKGGETQELIYRLSIRIAKIFSLLGYNSYKVKEIIRDAYKVRSLFVHGGHLSYREKRKLNDKYSDIRSFLLSLLDYLRISIIIMIFVKKEKEEFLDLIDDSLVDENKEKQLMNLLNSVKTFLGGNK